MSHGGLADEYFLQLRCGQGGPERITPKIAGTHMLLVHLLRLQNNFLHPTAFLLLLTRATLTRSVGFELDCLFRTNVEPALLGKFAHVVLLSPIHIKQHCQVVRAGQNGRWKSSAASSCTRSIQNGESKIMGKRTDQTHPSRPAWSGSHCPASRPVPCIVFLI